MHRWRNGASLINMSKSSYLTHILCSTQLLWKWKQWTENKKVPLEDVLLDLASCFWHASGVVFPWQAQNFTDFVACDILIYVEIKKEWRARPEEHDHRMNVPQLKSGMLLSFWGSTEIPMAYMGYFCLKHPQGFAGVFLMDLRKDHLGEQSCSGQRA